MDYTTLSLDEVSAGLDEIARDAQATFGSLDGRQLNWKPDATRWSVAQCVEHLLTANRLMVAAADGALDPTQPRSVWQRAPLLPGLFGRLLVRSQSPENQRKFRAAPAAQPATSDIAADVIARFIEQQRDAAQRVRALDRQTAAGTIMVSPFIRVITYSVLDGWRLMLAHDRRHIEQAGRVIATPGFPGPVTTA
jgi:DinB superfamily